MLKRTGLLLLGLLMTVSLAAWAELTVEGQLLASADVTDPDPARDNGDYSLTGSRSWLGIYGEESLRAHLTAIWRVESYVDLGNGDRGNSRDAYVGLRMPLGTLQIGNQATPYRLVSQGMDVFADTRGDFHAVIGSVGGEAIFDNRMRKLLLYQTPVIKGFQFSLAFSSGYRGNQSFTSGKAADQNAYSTGLVFDSGPLHVGLAYERLQDYVSSLPAFAGAGGRNAAATKLALGWDFGQGTRLALLAEEAGNGVRLNGRNLSRQAYYANIAQIMGNTTLKAAFGWINQLDESADSSAYHGSLGFSYAFSPRTEVYGLLSKTYNDGKAAYGLQADNDDQDFILPLAGENATAVSIGLIHHFHKGL